ncbi:MAG TPA: MotA/TolQ/ExbB proton channel family protein [Candidatus Binatia bacterium]|nr:MotA/TolQ/ExbB proton channel family protein [Candidatus Binatia bacterium]
MDLFSPIVRFFQAGGLFMYPIAVLLVIGVAIAIERWRFLRRSHGEGAEFWRQVTPLMQQKDFAGAEALARESPSAIGKVVAYGLSHARGSRRRGDIEMAIEESLMEVTSLLEKRTHYLATFANVATLLGLLGTISGLIRAFAAIASLNLAEKTDVLSASISEALNATMFGLLTAVPLLLIHSWLTTRTGELVDSLEMASVKFLNQLTAGEGA